MTRTLSEVGIAGGPPASPGLAVSAVGEVQVFKFSSVAAAAVAGARRAMRACRGAAGSGMLDS